jgi:hypothetical protein
MIENDAACVIFIPLSARKPPPQVSHKGMIQIPSTPLVNYDAELQLIDAERRLFVLFALQGVC